LTKPSKKHTNCFLIGSKHSLPGAKTLKGKGAKKAEKTTRMIKLTASSRFPCHKACRKPKTFMNTLKFKWIRGAQKKKTHSKKEAGYRICVGQAPKPKSIAMTHCTLLKKFCKKKELSTTGSFTLSSGGGGIRL